MRRNILVLGGGAGGLSVARALRRHIRPPDRISVIDRNGAHTQGLSLLWLMRGWRKQGDVVVDGVRNALGDIDLVRSEVTAIEPDARRVHTTENTLDYDALVVALGAELDIAAVPGLSEAEAAGAAVHYYSPAAAVHAHRRLRDMVSGKLVFLVAGMPYRCPGAPYEGAMLAADLLRETGVRDAVDIEVYSPEPLPMPVAGPVVGAGVVSMLAAGDISFHPGKQVVRVEPTSREIIFADGQSVSFDLLVFIPPHRAPKAVAALGLSVPGWIPVDPHTLESAAPRLWAMGDNASITLGNGKPLPKAAVFARGQAAAVAAGVARRLGYDTPEIKFDGVGHCYLEIGGHQAARGVGDFYADGGPKVALFDPSEELHREKELEESSWLDEWRKPQR